MGDISRMNDCMNIFEYIKDDICNQIVLIRQNAQKETNLYGEKIKYNRLEAYNETQYHNNISILGARGSGKTSLLINLRNYLVKQSQKNSDIVFDRITPDIKDKEDILGWIISLLIKVAKEIKLKKYPNDKLNCSVCKVQTDLDKCVYELKQSYFFRKTIHETIIAKDYSSKIDYLNDNEEKLNADVHIKNKVKKLISEIIKTLSEETKDTPLLIFIFDDVDIHSNKINEVLSIIMNYLSHPNIVNLIAGDYDSASENITLKMLEEDNILESGLMNIEINKGDLKTENVLEVRENRSYEFLKKILPPVYRHYIPSLDNKTKYEVVKKYLIDEINEDEFCKEIINKIKEYIYFNRGEMNEESDNVEILYDYMAFLDSSIRGTINVINFIKARVLDSRFKNLTKEEKFKFLKDLLNVIIVSNRNLTIREKLITDTINLSQYNHEFFDISNKGLSFNGYINYYAIVDNMERYLEENNEKYISENKFNTYYNIFMLANIFEIFIISLGLRVNETENSIVRLDRLHGLTEYIEIVNMIRYEDNIKIIPSIEDELESNKYMKESIYIKQNIFKSLRYNEVQQLFKEKNSGYLESIYIDSFNHRGEVARYIAEVFDKDKEWSKFIIDWIIENVPSEDIIKKKIINNLENMYGYNINSYNYNEIDKSKIKFDSHLVKIIADDIGQSIDDYIKFIRIRIEKESYEETLTEKLETQNKNIDKIRIDMEKIRGEINHSEFIGNIDIEHEKITKIIEDNNKFLNSEINKEAWRRVEKSLIIDEGSNLHAKNAFLINNILEIDIKLELRKIGIDSDFSNEKKKVIVIKNEIVDQDLINFIKEYYVKSRIKELLINQHPIMKLKSIEKYLLINEKEYMYTQEEIKKLKGEIELLEKGIKKNSIYKYISSAIEVDQHEISKRKLGIYIKECIELVLEQYESKTYKKNKFEMLLEYFYEYIRDIKSIDKNISELLSPMTVSLSEERIEMYKAEFKKIKDGITMIDINNIISNIRHNEKEKIYIKSTKMYKDELGLKISQLNSKLEQKKCSLNDSLFMLKKEVFQYAFFRTLNKHLQHTIDYEKEQMSKKIRTEYLINKRDKLEEISQDVDFISLKRYLKSKSN